MNKSRRDSNGLNKRERDILKFIQKEIITNGLWKPLKVLNVIFLNFWWQNARSDCSVALNGGEFHFSHVLKVFYVMPYWLQTVAA